ncbi:biotin--[acetyl-CoA-carboxylase] ligase [Paraliomyxa miuraensis]|uniref:biotin--[acetyl-CoA-carboxylase] ligase n=1 Tax=Paraliomyxa miuraensis TaxID=376150 RepID=UPI0022580534|nr:biotin--[acetyl-CoA-carboxylase] ligase [Paraliomyxa miuraensis]MCX4243535.1 biotin--[acetyl-CoA-carboxylase] ligase [Paraliomyxa miuraensis]
MASHASEDDDLRRLGTFLRGCYGRPHEHHAELSSTNDRALEWMRAGAPHGAVVTADAQRAGRGRRGRTWHSPPGESLYVSLVVRPDRPPDRPDGFGALGLAVGVGLHEGLPRLRAPVWLKWPNDLTVEGRKLGGILCEARWIGNVPEVVVGFGLNVHGRTFPEPLRALATSIALCRDGEVPGRAVLLAELLVALEGAIEPFLREGFAAVAERYLPSCEVLGRVVEVGDREAPDRARRAVAERLDQDGALWVRPVDGGPPLRVESSDVWIAP